jgi:alpha-L-glutamate ligase-like protein/uncharacterized protein (TIGR02421 family)
MKFLKNHGILGINARNLLYIRPYNKRKAVRLADDKLKSKQFLSARDIPVPRLYAVIRDKEELEKFDFSSLPSAFVVKPNMGFGGEGIIPFVGRKNDQFEKASGQLMNEEELREHIDDILEGRFSISGVTDVAFFEQLVICHDELAKFAYRGLPDIRIVVHNLIPVMAMLRLPTKESDGKANIHQGALGVGIDIAKGTATHIVQKGKIVDEVPEVGKIRGLKIPYWDEILLAASKVQLVTNLGYLAVDMVIDKNVGPVLLEINARAGLAVQIANLAPLRRRLERIQGVKVNTPEKGIRIAQDMFGNKLDKEVKKISGKEVIGSLEKVRFLGEGETRHLWASINPLLEQTLIDRQLAEELELDGHESSELFKMKFSLADKRIQTLVRKEDLSGKSYDLVVGRRDLQGFLIDPSKGKQSPNKLPKLAKEKTESVATGPNFKDIDQRIISVDRQIKLLHHLKPTNLQEEEELFMKDTSYNPQFQYPELGFDSFHLKEKLKKIEIELDDSPLGNLFLGKVTEIRKKIQLLNAIGTEKFSNESGKLFPRPSESLLKEAKKRLSQKPKQFHHPEESISMEAAIVEFERVMKEYKLDKWKIKVKESMVADCLAGKSNAFFVKEGASFDKDRMRMLIAHEIETHILTAENGKEQPYQLFNRGFANYLETQEGLAVWNQEQVLTHDVEKNYKSASNVFIIDFALRHSFAETFDYCRKLGMSKSKAFKASLRVKRGLEDTKQAGAFTKDALYFSGYIQIRDFVKNGGDLKDLYYGKYNLNDLGVIKKCPYLSEPKHLPKFLI